MESKSYKTKTYKMKKQKYLNDFHKETAERKLKKIQKLKNLEIDWEKELKQQKINARDD